MVNTAFDNFMFSAVPFIVIVIFAIVLLIFVSAGVKGFGEFMRNNSMPQETIPARLISKRTHVWGGSGDSSSHTSYYATFELENGERIEFPVRADFFSVHVEGDAGMLTRQGTRFFSFERERI